MSAIQDCLRAWHAAVARADPAALDDLLADDAVFHSPVVHTPQAGKAITRAYLGAAFAVLMNDSFTYVREVVGQRQAVLEFTVTLEDVAINGVDIIDCDEAGRITAFKVMIRPLKAIECVHRLMGEQLASRR